MLEQKDVAGMRSVIEARLDALNALGRLGGLVPTAEAVTRCPFELSDETLIGYPDYIMPRTVMNPRARRKTYLWDPRDIIALPLVLKRWAQAVADGTEAEQAFKDQRVQELTERDRGALAAILEVAA